MDAVPDEATTCAPVKLFPPARLALPARSVVRFATCVCVTVPEMFATVPEAKSLT